MGNITEQYLLWYRNLCGRIESKKAEIVNRFGADWYGFTHTTYFNQLSLVERKVVGGTIICARRTAAVS